MPETFSSEKEQEILALASRRTIYALVKKFSGCNFHELERKSGLPTSTLQYHLHYLTKHGLLSMQRDGNKIRYFTQHVPQEDKQLLVLLRQQTIRHLLLFILTHKTCRQKDLIDFLKLSPSTVSGYLARLVENGALQIITKHKENSYHLAVEEKAMIALLVTYKESFFDKLVDQTIEMWEFG